MCCFNQLSVGGNLFSSHRESIEQGGAGREGGGAAEGDRESIGFGSSRI